MATKKSGGTKPTKPSTRGKKQSGARTFSYKSTTKKYDKTGSTGPRTTSSDKKNRKQDNVKLSEYKQDYYQISGLASSTSRQLAFAGIALIWIFKTGNSPPIALPKDLLFPSGFLIFGLACDLLQYLFATVIWGSFHRYHEKKKNAIEEDSTIGAPKYLNWPTNLLFYSKILSVLIAYYFLLKYVWTAIEFT